MKIKPEHFKVLKDAITPLDTPELRQVYRNCGFSNMRYRWDLLRKAGLIPWVCETLYQYMNDDHIDTALRRVVAPLETQTSDSV